MHAAISSGSGSGRATAPGPLGCDGASTRSRSTLPYGSVSPVSTCSDLRLVIAPGCRLLLKPISRLAPDLVNLWGDAEGGEEGQAYRRTTRRAHHHRGDVHVERGVVEVIITLLGLHPAEDQLLRSRVPVLDAAHVRELLLPHVVEVARPLGHLVRANEIHQCIEGSVAVDVDLAQIKLAFLVILLPVHELEQVEPLRAGIDRAVERGVPLLQAQNRLGEGERVHSGDPRSPLPAQFDVTLPDLGRRRLLEMHDTD